MNKPLLATIIILFSVNLSHAAECLWQVRTSMEDIFCIERNDQWEIKLEKVLTLRYGDVRITPKDKSFSLMLYFKADTPDLAQFDTPDKIKKAVIASSRQYLPYVVEKEITLEPFSAKDSYGFINIFTDKELVGKDQLEEGEFKYLSRGMVRLSADSALGFSLMTNEIKTGKYYQLTNYILGFIK